MDKKEKLINICSLTREQRKAIQGLIDFGNNFCSYGGTNTYGLEQTMADALLWLIRKYLEFLLECETSPEDICDMFKNQGLETWNAERVAYAFSDGSYQKQGE